MGGAQPLAASMAGASLLAVECRPSSIEFRLRTGYVDVAAKDLDDALAIIEQVDEGAQGRLGRAARQCGRSPARASAPRRQARHRHRPDLGARSHQRLSAQGMELAAMGGAPRERSQGRRARRQSVDGRACAGDARLRSRRRSDRRLRQQHPPDGARGGRQGRVRLSRASCRPTSGRCSAAASGRSAGRRCRAIRRTFSGPTPRSRS